MLSSLNFKGFHLDNVIYEPRNYNDFEDESISIAIGYGIDVKNKENIRLTLGIKLHIDEEDICLLEITMSGYFKYSGKENIDPEIIKKNGSAILLPYMRTLVTTLTGYDSFTKRFVIPLINTSILIDEIDNVDE